MINKEKMLKANKELNNFLDIDIDTIDILRICRKKTNLKTLLEVLTKKEIEEILQDYNDSEKIKK